VNFAVDSDSSITSGDILVDIKEKNERERKKIKKK
jgi:hypothetical protein